MEAAAPPIGGEPLRSAVDDTLARARKARARRQMATHSEPPEPVQVPPPPARPAARAPAPDAEGAPRYHPNAERKLQRLREREEAAAGAAEEHRAAIQVITTVPDPSTRRAALRTMSASARVQTLLSMPDQEVQQIKRATSRAPAAVAAAPAPAPAPEPQANGEASADERVRSPELLHPGPHFSPHRCGTTVALVRCRSAL